MSFTGGTLTDGSVAITTQNIYTAPSVALCKWITFYNKNATQQTLNVYIFRVGSVERQIYRFVLDQYDTVTINETITLSTGDRLRASTTTASAVDYVISGALSA